MEAPPQFRWLDLKEDEMQIGDARLRWRLKMDGRKFCADGRVIILRGK